MRSAPSTRTLRAFVVIVLPNSTKPGDTKIKRPGLPRLTKLKWFCSHIDSD
jgi:hypothetical protein